MIRLILFAPGDQPGDHGPRFQAAGDGLAEGLEQELLLNRLGQVRLHAGIPPNATLCTFDLRGRPLGRFDRPLTAAAYVAWMELTGCDVFLAATREEAIAKMERALGEYVIEGISTTIPFHQQLFQNEKFREGDFTTKFLEGFELKKPG